MHLLDIVSEDERHKGIHEHFPNYFKSKSRNAHFVDHVALQVSGTRPCTSRR